MPAALFPQEVTVNSGVPGTQSGTSIAVFGSHVVAGYNQENGNQWSGAAYSTDGGVTFTDNGGLPVGNSTATLGGDPSVTVCGDGTFYYGSLYYPNATDSALSVSVGSFTGSTLTWSNPRTFGAQVRFAAGRSRYSAGKETSSKRSKAGPVQACSV